MDIGFATVDWARAVLGPDGKPSLGGSGTYRVGIPAKYLKRQGHRVVVGTLAARKDSGEFVIQDWDKEIHDGFDVIVMQRWMIDSLPQDMLRARANGQVIVNDLDDDFWSLAPSNFAHLATDPATHPSVNRNHYKAVLAASSLVTTSTPTLADKARSLGCPNVAVVRNALDAEMWPRPRIDTSGTSPVIGWVGAIPWRSGDLETLRGVLGPYLNQHHLAFHHSGAVSVPPSAPELLRLPPSVSTTSTPLCAIHHYPSLFLPMDIGLVPLSFIPFNEAKSDIKGLEYAIAGVPFVAASTQEYRRLYTDHHIGRTAVKPNHWRAHLNFLLDPETRKAEAKANRDHALAHFTMATRVTDWEAAYTTALSTSAAA